MIEETLKNQLYFMTRNTFIFSISFLLFSCQQSKSPKENIFLGNWEDVGKNNIYNIDTTNFITWSCKHSGEYKDMEVLFKIKNRTNEVIETKMSLYGEVYNTSANFYLVDDCNSMFIQYKSKDIYDFNMIDGAYNLIKNESTCPSDDFFKTRSSKKDSLIIDLRKNSELLDFHILYENDSIHTSFSESRKIYFEGNFYKESQCVLPAHTAYNRRRCFLKQENILLEIPILLYDSDTISVNKGFYLQSKGYNIISPLILKERTGISFNRNVEYFSLRKKS